ncbi:MAG: hypothetical protein ACJ74Y_13560 [Bryobacteraceae bacterium]
MSPDLILHLLSRFVHISSAILLLGGAFYARQVLVPVMSFLPSGQVEAVALTSQSRFRTTLWSLLVLIVLSGLYNFTTYSGPKHTSTYQMWFGIKMLLVLHVLATAVLWGTTPYSGEASIGKSNRRLRGMVISGFLIVLISAYLRSLSQRGL